MRPLYCLSEHLRKFLSPFCHHSTLEDSFNAAFRARKLHGEQDLLFHQLAHNRKQVITKLKVLRFFAIAELLPSF